MILLEYFEGDQFMILLKYFEAMMLNGCQGDTTLRHSTMQPDTAAVVK